MRKKVKQLNICKKLVGVLAVCMVLACTAAPLALATSSTPSIDTDADASLSLDYTYEGTPVEDACFTLFKVADVDADGNYTFVRAFAGAAIDLNSISTNEELQDAAFYLERYVDVRNLYRYYTRESFEEDEATYFYEDVETDENGNFVLENVDVGAYLVICDDYLHEDDEGEYSLYCCDPILVFVPSYSVTDGEWTYDVEMEPKMSVTELVPTPEPEQTPTPTPTPTVTPTPASTATPAVTTTPTPTETITESIPQTGVVTWPITLCAVLGCGCMIIGLALKRRG